MLNSQNKLAVNSDAINLQSLTGTPPVIATPFGLKEIQLDDLSEHYTSKYEVAFKAMWVPVLEHRVLEIWDIKNVPIQSIETDIAYNMRLSRWSITPMDTKVVYDVPPSSKERIESLKDIPFQFFLIAKEIRVIQDYSRPTLSGSLRDPLIIGIIPSAPLRGLYCVLAKWDE
jgi:hypothetical protein